MDNFNMFQTMTTTPRTFPQMDLVDVQGNQINVQSLTKDYHLIIITLKNMQCPVCPQLLKILNMYGLDPNITTYEDPFTSEIYKINSMEKKFFTLLLKEDSYFIILCPGTEQEVLSVQRKTPFMDYPFISGETAISLAKTLKVHLTDQDFMPAILEVSDENLAVDPIYIGRGPGSYFHQALLKRLIQKRCKQEKAGIAATNDSSELISQLKRRITKCQEGNMVSAFYSLTASHEASMNSGSSKSPTQRSSLEIPFGEKTRQDEESELLPPSLNDTVVKTIFTDNAASIAISQKDEKAFNSRSLGVLPLELLEIVFTCFDFQKDISSLVKASRVCRNFYIAACNAVIQNIRYQLAWLKPALPQQNRNVVCDEAEVYDTNLDRWSVNSGIPYCELKMRVKFTKQLLISITEWTSNWSPRKRNMTRNRKLIL